MKNFKQKPQAAPPHRPGITGQPVSKYMARNLITFTPETEILDAIDILVQNKISGAPVLNVRGEVMGMVDDKDCLRVLIDSAYQKHPVRGNTVMNYMDKVMRTVKEDLELVEAADLFLHSNYKRLLVVDANNRLIGQISRSDVLAAIGKLPLT